MQMNVQAYKAKQRLQLESKGLHIKGVTGDQWSDIRGPAIGNWRSVYKDRTKNLDRALKMNSCLAGMGGNIWNISYIISIA